MHPTLASQCLHQTAGHFVGSRSFVQGNNDKGLCVMLLMNRRGMAHEIVNRLHKDAVQGQGMSHQQGFIAGPIQNGQHRITYRSDVRCSRLLKYQSNLSHTLTWTDFVVQIQAASLVPTGYPKTAADHKKHAVRRFPLPQDQCPTAYILKGKASRQILPDILVERPKDATRAQHLDNPVMQVHFAAVHAKNEILNSCGLTNPAQAMPI